MSTYCFLRVELKPFPVKESSLGLPVAQSQRTRRISLICVRDNDLLHTPYGLCHLIAGHHQSFQHVSDKTATLIFTLRSVRVVASANSVGWKSSVR